MRTITAEQYRTMSGGDFDEAFLSEFAAQEIWDVGVDLDDDGKVVLVGPWGDRQVEPDQLIYVR